MNDSDLAADAPLVDRPLSATTQGHAVSNTTGRWVVHIGRLLYTHNPFYLISAWMVFSGLRASFPTSSSLINVWALSLCLIGYTVLLTVTAVLVIRIGKVWDDARSLFLLIVLMLLGISVTF